MVVINNIVYNYVINTTINHNKSVVLPKWLNEPENLDTNVWNKSLKSLNYIFRVTNSQKWCLDKLLKAHNPVVLYDDVKEKFYLVWISSLDNTLIHDKNYNYPWEIEIELISMAETLYYFGFEMISFTNKFEDGFERGLFTT
jgi:hypothetical protein